MYILHIASHLGDGAGKAISGLAILGSADNLDTHRILLLEKPRKTNHIEACQKQGIQVLPKDILTEAINWADVVVLNWWGGTVMEKFLENFPQNPCRLMLWLHKNGFYDPPLPEKLVGMCDHLLVTSPLTLTNTAWKDGTLVYGFGDFRPEKLLPKRNYGLQSDRFVIGYVGMPSYKRFPENAVDYFKVVVDVIPKVQFIMVGEYSEEFRCDLERADLLEHVKLLGWRKDVYALLAGFDVFGYLLRSDTFATTENSVLEAMAMGLPVVMPRKPIGKYVLGEGNGFLIETPLEFADAMRKLYQSQSLRAEKGQAARRYVLENYNVEDNMQRFEKACHMVLQGSKKLRIF